MTKREARDLFDQENRLRALNISHDDAAALHRISMTLRRWFELECGSNHGCIERDEQTNRPYWHENIYGGRFPVLDRETGARKRLAAIMAQYPTLTAYVQTDPRGCALYILTAEQLEGIYMIASIYTRGVAIA